MPLGRFDLAGGQPVRDCLSNRLQITSWPHTGGGVGREVSVMEVLLHS